MVTAAMMWSGAGLFLVAAACWLFFSLILYRSFSGKHRILVQLHDALAAQGRLPADSGARAPGEPSASQPGPGRRALSALRRFLPGPWSDAQVVECARGFARRLRWAWVPDVLDSAVLLGVGIWLVVHGITYVARQCSAGVVLAAVGGMGVGAAIGITFCVACWSMFSVVDRIFSKRLDSLILRFHDALAAGDRLPCGGKPPVQPGQAPAQA